MNKVYSFNRKQFVNINLEENRGFLYGDGFFETMVAKQARIIDLDLHLTRITKACQAYFFNISVEEIKNLLKGGLVKIDGQENHRIKLAVFRGHGGLYKPDSKETHAWLNISPFNPPIQKIKSALISKDYFTNYSKISEFKPLSASTYTLAGHQLTRSNYDEIILTDSKGCVAECLSSNIFWLKDEKLYTSNLQTGCINGIKRNVILKKFNVTEGAYTTDELKSADFIFTTNVAQSHVIKNIEGTFFNDHHDLYKDILEQAYYQKE